MILSIEKPIVTESGVAVGYHEVVSMNVAPDGDALVLNIHSWGTSAARLQYEAVDRRVEVIRLSELTTCSGLVEEVGAKLIGAGIFASGSMSTQSMTSEQLTQQRDWADAKARREAMEFGGFTWNNHQFDSTPAAVLRIQGAVLVALVAQASNTTYTEDWTLKDNTILTMTSAEIVQMGLALAEHIRECHEWGRTRRVEIFGAEEPPAPPPPLPPAPPPPPPAPPPPPPP